MVKIITYFVISILIGIAGIAAIQIIDVEPEPAKLYNITRSGVDSAEIAKYLGRAYEPTKLPKESFEFDWNRLQTMMTALFILAALIINKISTSKTTSFRNDFNDFKTLVISHLKDIIDTKERGNVADRIDDIEFIAAGLVADENLKIFIEGIGKSTRLFIEESMVHNFSNELLQRSFLKIKGRTFETINIIDHLDISNNRKKALNEATVRAYTMLKDDLKALAKDHIFNDRYDRFGDILCMFFRSFLNDVMTVYNDKEIA